MFDVYIKHIWKQYIIYMDKKVIIIPTYNEKENIEKIIRAVFALEGEYHILVIEDGSPDGTAAIVKMMQAEFPERLHMIERTGKLGLGTAYITDSNGLSSMDTTIFLKWMLTFHTILMMFLNYIRHARTEQTLQSVQDTAKESA